MTSQWQRWCTEDHKLHRYEFWRDAVCSGVIESDLTVDAKDSFNGTMFSKTRADVGLVNFASTGHTIRRSTSQARRHGSDRIMLSLQCQGHAHMSQSGSTHVVAPGEFGLLNAGAAFDITFPEATSRRLILLPHHLFGARSPLLKRLDRPAKIPADAYLSPLLAQTVLLLTDMENEVNEGLAAAMMGTVVEMLALQFESTEDVSALSRSTTELSFQKIRSFVDLHVADPELAPASVAAACRISVRTLHRLFARYLQTSFESYVIDKRLELTYEVLGSARTRTVSEAAYACGFNNVSHFTKRFSERFGVSPLLVLKGLHKPPH